MAFFEDNKKEIIFVLIVLFIVYWYYTNYYAKGKKLLDVFKPAPPVVAPIVATEEPAPAAEAEEFQNDIKFKDESLRRHLF